MGEREQRKLAFKEGIKQKTSVKFGRLGRMKNTVVEKLISIKDKVVDFGTTQMANYYLKQDEKREIKSFKEAARLAEKQEIELQKARIKERKAAMKEALNLQEREMYEQKHIENQARKEELLTSIFGEKEEPEMGDYARAH